MSAVDATTIAALIVTILTTIVVPWWLRRRQRHHDIDETGLKSWQAVTKVLQEERDGLKKQIADMDRDFGTRLKTMEAEYTRQLDAARERIMALEEEVEGLYIRLGRGESGKPPSR